LIIAEIYQLAGELRRNAEVIAGNFGQTDHREPAAERKDILPRTRRGAINRDLITVKRGLRKLAKLSIVDRKSQAQSLDARECIMTNSVPTACRSLNQ
jgi:hypothetical protein